MHDYSEVPVIKQIFLDFVVRDVSAVFDFFGIVVLVFELKEYLDDLVQKYNEYLLKINPNLYIVKPIEIFGYFL